MGTPAPFELGNRSSFPDLSVTAYLNHAAISPACDVASKAVQAALQDYARFGAMAFPRWEERRQTLRADIARFIGADSGEIAFGWNTSRGVSDVALSIPWRKADRVLLLSGEFPANVTPWQRAAEHFGLEVVFHAASDFDGPRGLSRLEEELKRGLRLVAISAVQFQTGLRMPIAQISALCHAHGAELFVDAIQACGALPIDVVAQGIDYLVTGGHKWLLGFEGAGFIYVQADAAKRLVPLTASWLSHEEPIGFLFGGSGLLRYDRPLRTQADVFETGTSSLLGLAALGATVPRLCELGPANVLRHVNGYIDELEAGLLQRGFRSLRSAQPEHRSTLFCVQPPSSVELRDLARALTSRGIVVGTPDGNLRFAPHFANSLSEVPQVLSAVDQALETTAAR